MNGTEIFQASTLRSRAEGSTRSPRRLLLATGNPALTDLRSEKIPKKFSFLRSPQYIVYNSIYVLLKFLERLSYPITRSCEPSVRWLDVSARTLLDVYFA